MKVGLVACGAAKRDRPCRAADLYTSTLFKLSRRYVEVRGPWFILSARHGVLAPDKVVAPYNQSLNAMDRAQRAAWAADVQRALHELGVTEATFLGSLYEPAVAALTKVERPLAGLGLFQRTRWLKEQVG